MMVRVAMADGSVDEDETRVLRLINAALAGEAMGQYESAQRLFKLAVGGVLLAVVASVVCGAYVCF